MKTMALLPAARITDHFPFSALGVDYCSPFTLGIGIKRLHKTSLANFIWMTASSSMPAPRLLFTRFRRSKTRREEIVQNFKSF